MSAIFLGHLFLYKYKFLEAVALEACCQKGSKFLKLGRKVLVGFSLGGNS